MKPRNLSAVALAALLNGCFFVYVPGSAIDALVGGEGNLCVAESAKVGDKIRMPQGGTGTVQKLTGTSSRCNQAVTPIRAVVVAEP